MCSQSENVMEGYGNFSKVFGKVLKFSEVETVRKMFGNDWELGKRLVILVAVVFN